MVDGVSDFNIATDRAMEGYKPHGVTSTLADYKLEAVSEVARVTQQRVTSFVSSHDPDTDVATETFTLGCIPRRRGTRRHEPDKRASDHTVATSFLNGDRVVTTEAYRGFDFGLSATVVSVHEYSGIVTIAPLTHQSQSVFLSVDPSSLRHLGS